MKIIFDLRLTKQGSKKRYDFMFGNFTKVKSISKPLTDVACQDEMFRKIFMMSAKDFIKREHRWYNKNIAKISFNNYVTNIFFRERNK